jgi:hypothetical protein
MGLPPFFRPFPLVAQPREFGAPALFSASFLGLPKFMKREHLSTLPGWWSAVVAEVLSLLLVFQPQPKGAFGWRFFGFGSPGLFFLMKS